MPACTRRRVPRRRWSVATSRATNGLFPETAERWQDLVERGEGLYTVAMTLRKRDYFEPLEVLREQATFGADGIAERHLGMASYEVRASMGESEQAEAAVRALMAG